MLFTIDLQDLKDMRGVLEKKRERSGGLNRSLSKASDHRGSLWNGQNLSEKTLLGYANMRKRSEGLVLKLGKHKGSDSAGETANLDPKWGRKN